MLLDDEFEQAQREAEAASEGVLWDDTEVAPFGSPPPPPSAESAEEWAELTDYDWDKLKRD